MTGNPPFELSITRLIDAPVDAVWRAWSERGADWLCPRPWRAEIVEQWARMARPRASVLSIAGAVGGDGGARAIGERLDTLLAGWSGDTPEPALGPATARGYAHELDRTNQVQIVVMHDAPPECARPPGQPDEAMLERAAVSVLSGGMSGRLFSEVREKRGLCYSVSAAYRGDRRFGAVTAYVGTTPERAAESLRVLIDQLERLATPEGRVTKDEFDRAIVGMKSSAVFSGESTGARAGALAQDQRRLGRPRSLGEIVRAIDALTLDQLNAYLASRRLGTLTIQTLGPAPIA